ncbi:MAG: hypothetical protein H6622_03655 [Halobacteriovoraceae bacterium]|nr:hypothetical protein [Halobacteriovoraceae bacterium]
MKLLILLSAFIINSCSYFKAINDIPAYTRHEILSNEDYIRIYNNLSDVYKSGVKNRIIPLSKKSNYFLDKIYRRIVERNSKALNLSITSEIKVISDVIPYIFSLPNGRIFFSSGLINKYLKNEEVFVAALAFEIFKSHQLIFRKQFVIPKGNVTSDRILRLVSIDKEQKLKINEWCYNLLMRSGYDPFVYLVWLQIQNKNALDFSMMNSSEKFISTEEYSYKKLLTQTGRNFEYESDEKINSSQEFYYFVREVEKKANVNETRAI